MAQLGARLDGIEEVVGSNPIGSTNILVTPSPHNIQTNCGRRPGSLCHSLYRRLFIRAHPRDPSKTRRPVRIPEVLRVRAIPEKNGKTEYQVDALNPEQTVTCVHSLFPHMSYSPCWYVKPSINQPIPM